jgi:excisionase family DNA binding protein
VAELAAEVSTENRPLIGKAVLTLAEAALVMRCSKAHVQSVIQGRVNNVPPLPSIRIGRRILIRRESLERWMRALESPAGGSTW